MKPAIYAALLGVGVLTGWLTHGQYAPLFGLLTLEVFIPALIFEAAWGLDVQLMRSNARPIVLLAVPGVAITAGVIAAATHYAGLPWHPALVLGAILSATDPIAVVAIFRRLNVPAALATIVESESLLNDAIAVVLFRAVLAAAALSAAFGVVYSVAVGVALGWLASFALRRHISTPVQIAATLAGAYGVYVLCERIGGAGIFGVVAFAITLRAFERYRLTSECAQGVSRFWTVGAIAANCVLFFFLGAAVDVGAFPKALPIIAATAAAVAVSRVLLAYGLLQLARKYVRTAWMHVVRMAGVRGALPVALALALPASLADRAWLIDATFTIAAVTIVLGTLTYERRLGRLDLSDP